MELTTRCVISTGVASGCWGKRDPGEGGQYRRRWRLHHGSLMADLANVACCADLSRTAAGRRRGAGCTHVAWAWGGCFPLGSPHASSAHLCQGCRVCDKLLHAGYGKQKDCHGKKRQDEYTQHYRASKDVRGLRHRHFNLMSFFRNPVTP